MGNIFQECQHLKATLDELRPLKPEDEQRIMQKFRLDWNYHSNHLEGNSLTYGETKALILFGITAQGKPLKDHIEITGHNEAVNWILDVVKEDRQLSENFIRELHKLILKAPYEVDALTPDGKPTKKKIKIGEYKRSPNHVKTKTGEMFYFATPEETPAKMFDLLKWFNEKSKEADVNPILLASKFHYEFIRIHPFDDGNGRTARILMNFILLRFGYPPVVVKTEDKENYFAALRLADAGQFEAFATYIANNMKASLEIMISGAKGESIEEPDDLEKEIALLEQSINSVAKPVISSKDHQHIINIFDSVVEPLTSKFYKKGKMLSRFYIESHLYFAGNIYTKELDISYDFFGGFIEAMLQDYKENNYSNEVLGIKYNYNHIFNSSLKFLYKKFNYSGFSDFDFHSEIKFSFKEIKYIVSNSKGIIYEKFFNEKLSMMEIDNLVNTEIRYHKQFIESKMIEQKKSNLEEE